MLIEQHGPAVLVRAPAKVNLFLEVLRRRDDGYHDLATLLVAVGLYDTLEFREESTDAVSLQSDHPNLSTGPDNLICRAVELVKQTAGVSKGVAIRLWKRIPLAAGLAGGSTDAAATLAGLNRLWRLGWDQAKLAELGARLGSDVAFFFSTPAAWCTGRGEIVEPVKLGRALDFVLVCPPVGCSTAEVFRNVSVPAEPLSGDEVRRAAVEGDVEKLGVRLFNRLQPAAERLCPQVAALHRELAELRVAQVAQPAGQLMSGSGSTVFALCRQPGEALRIARALRSQREEGDGVRVLIVRSCS
jgi:4-diphosphocytidyl-2-C-methyl-D-erythritol kinase